MTTLNPYPAYKDSGIEWLGDVPEHWGLTQLARLADEKKIRNDGLREKTVLSLSYGRIIIKTDIYAGLSPADFATYQIVDPGNVILRLTDLQNDQRSLRVGLSQNRGIITSAYVCLRPSTFMDPRFIYRMLHDFDVKKMFYGMGAGVRQGLSYKELRKTVFAVPPLDEQRAIADFLDGMDARITRFLAARRKMIALLEERKQAVINQAVTRGLDPDVPLKDSGVDWLGEIPAHWEVRRFKHLTSINSGQVDPTIEPFASQILIAPNHIVSGVGKLTDLQTAGEQGADSGKYQVQVGQVVYSKIRPYLRKAAIAPFDCLCSADMYAISPKDRVLSAEFLMRSLLSPTSTQFIVDTSLRARMPKVNRQSLGGLVLTFPSIEQQGAIVDHIDRETARIDMLIDRHRREIDLIQEYRTRLISDVVTGKWDVRGAELTAVEEVIGEEIEAAMEEKIATTWDEEHE